MLIYQSLSVSSAICTIRLNSWAGKCVHRGDRNQPIFSEPFLSMVNCTATADRQVGCLLRGFRSVLLDKDEPLRTDAVLPDDLVGDDLAGVRNRTGGPAHAGIGVRCNDQTRLPIDRNPALAGVLVGWDEF